MAHRDALADLPIHASWLNQVEIYFSVPQRKAISAVDFANLDALADQSWPPKIATTGRDTVRLGPSAGPSSARCSTAWPCRAGITHATAARPPTN
ncbi:hypothetical protein K1T35_37235 [Pseudonocardia sp. DSM 110487]|uniref:hypothetical protein n=1 Tax=Pseudonocardia sp. DSM 110487 TaxID=2865833 RepID=UPI001C6A2D2B|nr:hypothetical protein [Pseudonocardia sp. DSM 110487]QYN34038.1 hypothetical protein K1T35_37235 [Pseudonocardia sp. DSM 110487]